MPIITVIRNPRLPKQPKKRVAAYARVSVAMESPLHSLSAQVSYYSNLIQSNREWEYAGVYADAGVSGTSTKHRDEFNRLMTDCEAGKIDIILVKSISRFARNTVDCLNTIRHLKSIGVEVRFEREGISTMTSDGELLLTLLASFAQAESESISGNTRWATRKRFEQGIPNGHKPPYGYRWDGEMFRIIPEQGEVVKYIYKRYLAGDSGYAIAKDLKEQGVVGQSGRPMCDSTIKDIVTNISYTGTMILQKHFITEAHVRKRNRGELPRYAVEEMFEPLVSVEDFEQAQAIRQQRASEVHSMPTRFSGLVKCGECGNGVYRRYAGKAKKWVCNGRERLGICDMMPVMESELLAAVGMALGEAIGGTGAAVEGAGVVSVAVDAVVGRSGVAVGGTAPSLGAAAGREVGGTGHEPAGKNDDFKQIVIYHDRIEIHQTNGRIRSVARSYDGFNVKRVYSGRLICGECGAKLYRDTWKTRRGDKVISWGCTSPRSSCSLKCLHEDDLKKATAAVLERVKPDEARCKSALGKLSPDKLTPNNCEPAFARLVRQAVVFSDRIQFELKDGTVRTWRRDMS